MKYFVFIVLMGIISPSLAQSVEVDSIGNKSKSKFKTNTARIDSSSQRVNKKIDSVQLKLNQVLSPNLSSLYKKIDLTKGKSSVDSLEAARDLDSIKGKLNHKVDSLKRLNLPTDQFTRKLDSLNQIGPTKYIHQGEAKVNELQNKINQPVDNVEGKINDKLALMNKEGGGKANLPGSTNIPGVELDPNVDLKGKMNLPNTELKTDNPLGKIDSPLNNRGEVGELKEKMNEVKSVPQGQIDKLKSMEEVKSVEGKVSNVNDLTDKAQSYQSDVKNLSQGKVEEVKQLPKTLENQAVKMGDAGEFQKQSVEIDKYKGLMEEAKAKEMLKSQAKQQVALEAKNHFAGHEKALQVAMDKMGKLKPKYGEVKLLNDSLKHRPNSLRGKPFVERVIPGITFQIQKSDMVEVDFNPWLAYRLHRRMTLGAGWNERIGIQKKFNITSEDRIYGPRVFLDLVLKKGFSVRTDIEKMNANVQSLNPAITEASRAWVWSAFVGFKKQYQFVKRVKGNFQFLYNVYDDHDRSPYADKFNVRFGFEFPLKKAK